MPTDTPVRVLLGEGLQKDLEKLAPADSQAVLDAIRSKLTVDPASAGEALNGDMAGYYQMTVGNVRVVYKVTEKSADAAGETPPAKTKSRSKK